MRGRPFAGALLCLAPVLTLLGSAWLLITVVRWLRCRDLQTPRGCALARAVQRCGLAETLISLWDVVTWAAQWLMW
jgi:hypothetical protein